MSASIVDEGRGRLARWMSPQVELPRVDTEVAGGALAVEPRALQSVLSVEEVMAMLLRVTSEKTGYGIDELDPEYELEADLGVDTVKQAEIFGEMREQMGLSQDDNVSLADHPTIAALARYLSMLSAGAERSEELNFHPVTTDPHALPEAQGLVRQSDPEPLADPDEVGLPESFRVRRPVLIPQSIWGAGSLSGCVVEVIGDGPLADAMRATLDERGAVLYGQPELIVDASADVMHAFERARALDGARPRGWLCATRLGADPTEVPAELGARAGARAGPQPIPAQNDFQHYRDNPRL